MEWNRPFHVVVEVTLLFLLWIMQMVMIRTIKTEKEEEVVVEGKEKNVQYCPHTI